jgi:hypothetical protein
VEDDEFPMVVSFHLPVGFIDELLFRTKHERLNVYELILNIQPSNSSATL